MIYSLSSFVSASAEITCLLRAKSFNEKVAIFKTDDFIAVPISNTFTSFSAKMIKAFLFSENILGLGMPPGAYEYIVARTHYLDQIFSTLSKKYKQVFIFGAGFDSRSCRFQQQLTHARVYECDHPDMQLKKKAVFEKIGIPFPPNVEFIPMDFAENDVAEIVNRRLIPKGETCLFILEGLLCYLDEKQVDALFSAIAQHAGPLSEIIFDYVHAEALRGDNNHRETVKYIDNIDELSRYWTFGLAQGQVKQFLKKFDFSVIEDIDSKAMERVFFADDLTHKSLHIMSSQSLVRAEKCHYP